MKLPKILVDFTQEGRTILFLGAGASRGCLHPGGKQPPTAVELSQLIADKFLGKDFSDRALSNIAELAISESNLFEVQEFIASIFKDFSPANFHKLIPKFSWRMIATTNYDLILERAYAEVVDPIQRLSVFKKDGERIEEKIRSPASLMYVKLHGCITDINDPDIPLILTPDQYVTHLNGRKRLFERFESFSNEYPIIFVGHSLGDMDIRAILLRLEKLGEARPRSYIVTPSMTDAEITFWQAKKISPIKASFKEFLVALDGEVPSQFRRLTPLRGEHKHPIYPQFDPSIEADPSPRLHTLITRDLEYVNKEITPTDLDPKAFYKGYFIDWSPIIHDLDVPRGITENILSEVILSSEEERPEKQELYIIRGHAGSGKSVILNRLAWDASISFNKLCLKANLSSYIEYEPLVELYRYCNQRIFLFFDPINDFNEVVENILIQSQRDELPLTIIGAVRPHEWNIQCENLDPFVTDYHQVRYLSETEIEHLIDLLTKHKSLGYLEDLGKDAQLEALVKRAGRQLLVALHEATLGKPFEEIVFDEYESISSLRAKNLYLTVCIFSMLGVPARAGLISRVHNIPFREFQEKLFKPLELIVFAHMNKIIQDFEYRARHSHIAEIVFERVLSDPEDRFNEISRVMSALDIDFSSDMDAFRGLMNAKRLLGMFNDPQMIRQLFSIAHSRDENNEKLLQQEAIFEMISPGGSLDRATDLLEKSSKIAPHYKPVKHSLAVLASKKAEQAKIPLEKKKYRDDSKKLAIELISDGTYSAHPYHTLIVVGLEELEDILEDGDERSIERKMNNLEKTIANANQAHPDDGHLLEAQARFNELLNQNEKALAILKKAFRRNVRNPYIASRLSNMYEDAGRFEESIEVIRQCLDANPRDKILNFRLGMLLSILPSQSNAEIRHHLRSSFTHGDSNFAAQFWYARFVYLDGDFEEAKQIFYQLGKARLDIRIRQKPRGKVYKDKKLVEFNGIISRKEANYAFITRDKFQDSIFTHRKYNENWESLMPDMRVNFNLAFNYRGPFAQNVSEET